MTARRALALLLALAAAPPAARAQDDPPERFRVEVVRSYPHDPEAFTQGLLFHDGWLFESTGLNGASTVRRVRLETGEVVSRRALPDEYFGEGLARWDDRLLQLTWVSGRGFLYALDSLEPAGGFRYEGEGWGLTADGRRLILSDGTAWLRFLDPGTLTETGRVRVTDGGAPVDRLNELEFVDGRVYANVWLTDRIAIIDPASGRVTGWIDLAGLLPGAGGNDVLNGIAWDAAAGRLFVTGKRWPRLFEVRLVPEAPPAR